jgi:hypothetical protein
MVPVCRALLTRHGLDLGGEREILDFGCGVAGVVLARK